MQKLVEQYEINLPGNAKPPECEDAIAAAVPTMKMTQWFVEVLDTPDFYLNPFLLVGAYHRFREVAHFSKKLSEEQRDILLEQAEVIFRLINETYRDRNPQLVEALQKTKEIRDKVYEQFGYPKEGYWVRDFEEL